MRDTFTVKGISVIYLLLHSKYVKFNLFMMKYICLITYSWVTSYLLLQYIYIYIYIYKIYWKYLEHCHKYKKLAILLKVTLLRERFSLFLNCANGTKSSKASHISLLLLQLLLRYHYLNCRERMNHEQMGKHTIVFEACNTPYVCFWYGASGACECKSKHFLSRPDDNIENVVSILLS